MIKYVGMTIISQGISVVNNSYYNKHVHINLTVTASYPNTTLNGVLGKVVDEYAPKFLKANEYIYLNVHSVHNTEAFNVLLNLDRNGNIFNGGNEIGMLQAYSLNITGKY